MNSRTLRILRVSIRGTVKNINLGPVTVNKQFGKTSNPGRHYTTRHSARRRPDRVNFAHAHESKIRPSPSVLQPAPDGALIFLYPKYPATNT